MNELIAEVQRNVQQLSSRTEAARVFHGRGKSLPGYENMTVEYFSGTLVVILFSERNDEWIKMFTANIKNALTSIPDLEVLFQARYTKGAPVFNSQQEAVEIDKVIIENNLKYHLHLGGRQNFGFFTDMKNGRQWVTENSRHRKVLNLFSYTCSFSVAAVAGGADQVINIDMSAAALGVGRQNHRLNKQLMDRVLFQKLNILKSWGRIKKYGPYDLVIVDPPSFQKGSFSFSKDYQKMVTRLAEMTMSDADVLFCLNDPFVTVDAFKALISSEHFTFVARIENPVAMKEVQEDLGLKVLHYKKVSH